MSEQRFDVHFDKDAFKEYEKLDNSVVVYVDKALEELEMRADEVGKDLINKRSTKLHGCKEIKLKDAGVRIVFRVTSETVEVLRIVYILAIEKRERDFAFRVADKRFRQLKSLERAALRKHLKRAKKWSQRNKPQKGNSDR